jgi:hypothetical protein
VLVIIGLIVGGVLVGQSLISAAEVRAQITQIEKYNAAVNTFRSKFNAIPGDMRPEIVTLFGFVQGSACDGRAPGFRNGDGVLDGYFTPQVIQRDENILFWMDLSNSAAGPLIEGSYPNSSMSVPDCSAGHITPMAEPKDY